MTEVYWIRVPGGKILHLDMKIFLKAECEDLLIQIAGRTPSDDYRYWPHKDKAIDHLQGHSFPDQWGWTIDRGISRSLGDWDALLFFKDPAIATYFKLLWGGTSDA